VSRLPLLALIAAMLLWLWPVVGFVGHPFGEADNHLWMLWRAMDGRSRLANWPVGVEIPLMDPVNLAWAAPAWPLGPAAAWTAVRLANVAIAGLGGWFLGRELGGTTSAAVLGTSATAFSPFLAGALDFGLTEAWPLGWLALHLAALARARHDARAWAAASATLSAFLLSGWYHALFALLLVPGLVAWIRRPIPHVAAMALASLPVLPRAVATLDGREVWATRFHGLDRALAVRDWASVPRFGTDLLNLLLPRLDSDGPSFAVYLGMTTLLLALAGLRRREARWLLGGAALLWVFALGHRIRVAGQPLAVGPAGWLVATFPVFQGFTHWYRACGPATVLLAGAAAVGGARLSRGVATLVAALVVLESAALSSAAWPRRSRELPANPLDGLAAGPVLDLPLADGPLRGATSRRPYALLQLAHGHPIAENDEGPDAVLDLPGVRALNDACVRGGPGPDALSLPGFTWVIVHRSSAGPRCADLLARWCGAPVREGADVVFRAPGAPSPP
jgi:hypothetical protein